MRRVIIESPYGSPDLAVVQENINYARCCVRNRVLSGDAPIASHLLFTQPNILDDMDPNERALGIAAGLAWFPVADAQIFFVDRGWSRGMLAALDMNLTLKGQHPKIEIRALFSQAQYLPNELYDIFTKEQRNLILNSIIIERT